MFFLSRATRAEKSRCSPEDFRDGSFIPTQLFWFRTSSADEGSDREETHTALDEVDRIYEEELSQLASDAKITQYLGVLVSKRVRMKLRNH